MKRKDGRYYYKERGVPAQKYALLLFSHNNEVIASAVFLEQNNKEKYFKVDIKSIKTFESVSESELKKHLPGFDGFKRMKKKNFIGDEYTAAIIAIKKLIAEKEYSTDELAGKKTEINIIANKLNELSKDYEIGKLQKTRKIIRGLKRVYTFDIFSSETIKERYAFHSGGRTELQYNIGFDFDGNGAEKLRYGLAFSLKESRSLPSISALKPQILNFNILLKNNPDIFSDYMMWEDFDHKITVPHLISSESVKTGNFIFLGKLTDSSDINYKEILSTFDAMLPIYEYVMTETDGGTLKETTKSFEFTKTNPKPSKKHSYFREQIAVDVDARHYAVQEKLYKQLSETYGEKYVSKEHPIFGRNKIDIAVKNDTEYFFYEIKITSTARECIRQAMGQILEYGYYPGKKNADKLIIVGEHEPDQSTDQYLKFLGSSFGLSLEYLKIKAD